jgi:PAS domain-containing protein
MTSDTSTGDTCIGGAAAPRIDLLVQSVTDYAIYMLDPTGIVISWNAGAERFKGYASHEIVGRHFSNFYTDEERGAVSRQSRWRPRRARATSRSKAGACARTAPISGRTSSSTPCTSPRAA